MTTDHRAEADRQMAERTTYGVWSEEANLLAAIHDLLDERLPKPPTEAPEGTEGAERPTAANLRVGWLSALGVPPRLAREITDGWTYLRTDDGPVWGSHDTDIVFTPFTPADFGWTVLSEGQVAVERVGNGDPEQHRRAARGLAALGCVSSAMVLHAYADALDGSQP